MVYGRQFSWAGLGWVTWKRVGDGRVGQGQVGRVGPSSCLVKLG